jgi:WD40 repeat protein
MRVAWTTYPGPDPALTLAFPADRPAAVATAVVEGRPVLVTLTDEHEDFDCELGDLHAQRCPEPGLRIWDRASGDLVRSNVKICDNGTGHPARLITLESGGRWLAVVGDWARPPKLVDLGSGRVLGPLPGHEDARDVQDLAVVDGPRVVTCGWDGLVRVTDVDTGRTLRIDAGDRLNAVAVTRIGGRALVAAARDEVGLWDPDDGSRAGAVAAGGSLSALVGWPGEEGLLAGLGFDGVIRVWELRPGGPGSDGEDREPLSGGPGSDRVDRQPLSGGPGIGGMGRELRPPVKPTSIAAVTSVDGRPMLAFDAGGGIELWDVTSWRSAGAALTGPVRLPRMIGAGSPPHCLIAGSAADDTVSVWRVGDRPPAGDLADLTSVTVTTDGWVVTGGTDGVLRRHRLTDGGRGPDLGRLPARVNAVAAAGDHLLAAGGDLHDGPDPALHRWTGDRAEPGVPLDHQGQTDTVRVWPAGDQVMALATGSGSAVPLIVVRTGEIAGVLDDAYPARGVATGAWDGRPVAAINRMFGTFAVWDLTTRTVIPTAADATVEFGAAPAAWLETGDGPAVVTVHGSRVSAHHLRSGTVTTLQPGNPEPVTAIAATGDRLAIARTDHVVTVLGGAVESRAGMDQTVEGRAGVDHTVEGRAVEGWAVEGWGRIVLPAAAAALAWAPDGSLIAVARRHIWRMVPGADLG